MIVKLGIWSIKDERGKLYDLVCPSGCVECEEIPIITLEHVHQMDTWKSK